MVVDAYDVVIIGTIALGSFCSGFWCGVAHELERWGL